MTSRTQHHGDAQEEGLAPPKACGLRGGQLKQRFEYYDDVQHWDSSTRGYGNSEVSENSNLGVMEVNNQMILQCLLDI